MSSFYFITFILSIVLIIGLNIFFLLETKIINLYFYDLELFSNIKNKLKYFKKNIAKCLV